jgi:hypothetical protein
MRLPIPKSRNGKERNKMKAVCTRKRATAVALAVLGIAIIGRPAEAKTGLEMYDHVKKLEDQIPMPTPHGTGVMGTYDPVTRKFSGLVTTETIEYDPTGESGPKKPIKTKDIPAIRVNGVTVGLVFKVKNPTKPFNVRCLGHIAYSKPGEDQVVLNVGKQELVNWTLTYGEAKYTDRVEVVRPPIIGAGAFTIPAIPIAFVYEPPQDKNKRNTASYSQMKSVGTTVRMGFSEEKSTTTATQATHFQGAMAAKSALNKIGDVCEKIPNPYVQAAGAVIKLIAGGLGDTSANETKGTKVTTDKALQLSTSQTDIYQTGAHEGPGRGDRILYLTKPRLMWVASGAPGGLGVTLLGHEGISSVTVGFLQDNVKGIAGLNEKTIRAMLKLNPFMRWNSSANPRLAIRGKGGIGPADLSDTPSLNIGDITKIVLDEERFRFVEHYEINGGQNTHIFHTEIQQSDLKANADFTTNIEDYRKGWLSFIGLGVTEDTTYKTTVSHSASQEINQGSAVECRVELFAAADEFYGMDAYYDSVFGTFAFMKSDLGDEYLSGVAKDEKGAPKAKQLITVEVAGRKYSTHTDAQGKWALRSNALRNARGEANVKAGGVVQKVQLNGAPIKALELKVMPGTVRPGGGLLLGGK